MSRSTVVIELANLASQGKYNVTPVEAIRMNKLFEEVAKVINELETEEATAKESTDGE